MLLFIFDLFVEYSFKAVNKLHKIIRAGILSQMGMCETQKHILKLESLDSKRFFTRTVVQVQSKT